MKIHLPAAAAALLVAGAVTALPAAGGAPGAPAQVVDYAPPARTESFSYVDYGKSPSRRDDTKGKSKFRVVERTGNCCENYVTIDSDGTLYDIGGAYINFTSDDGKTWRSVRPLEPLVNGEGTISMAPNGDVVGVEWDPYSGDHLLSYKYDAELEQWQYLEMPLHTPFYDRPWLTVVPGPFTVLGSEVPYVVFVDGLPHGGPFLYSTDGITYVEMSNPALDERFEPPFEGWLETREDKSLEWTVPNTNSPIIALGRGYAIARPGPLRSGWSLFDAETMRWSALRLPEGSIPEKLMVDAHGRLHAVVLGGDGFEYRISTNGARSWTSLATALPKDTSLGDGSMMDYRVNLGAGVAAVALHASNAQGDRDLVYTFDVTGDEPRLLRRYDIGLGDVNAAAGLGQNIRFDFETVAVFPDGRIAVSYLDSTTGPVFHLQEPISERLGPALAIEL